MARHYRHNDLEQLVEPGDHPGGTRPQREAGEVLDVAEQELDPGSGAASLDVQATQGSCGIGGGSITCRIVASFNRLADAEYYTASVTAPDGSVSDLATRSDPCPEPEPQPEVEQVPKPAPPPE
jgi:hypothetical protein